MKAPYEQLEHDFALFMGYKPEQMVACSSGTAALHLALEAVNVQGRCVFVPDYTMVACPRAVALAGGIPFLIDCNDELQMDVSSTKRAFEDVGPRAVMLVHVYGRSPDVPSILSIFPRNTYIVEDLSEMHGVTPHPRTDAACWSFYANKGSGGEEGGAVAFRDVKHANRARQLRSLGFTPEHDFTHVPRGHNYRLANSLANLIRGSLDNYLLNVLKRRSLEMQYSKAIPQEVKAPWDSKRVSPWVYDLVLPIDKADRRDELVLNLQKAGIAARHGFRPIRIQEEFKGCRFFHNGAFSTLHERILYLPLTPHTLPSYVIADRAAGVLRDTLDLPGPEHRPESCRPGYQRVSGDWVA